MELKYMKEIYLAGGCFWGLQAYMDLRNGIVETVVGYANGNTESPTYQQVCTNTTGYAEAVYIKYDENIITLEKILQDFWKVIDPTLMNRQGGDVGTQYRTGIYYTCDEDLTTISKSMDQQREKYNKPIVTELETLKNFYPAEEYHQKYLEKNPNGYCHIDLTL
jgi:peptide-methionine (S)-S-oxide reductase